MPNAKMSNPVAWLAVASSEGGSDPVAKRKGIVNGISVAAAVLSGRIY
jgi:hypothetical protein